MNKKTKRTASRKPAAASPILRLPHEILATIFKYAYDTPDDPPKVPSAVFCRHLQPHFVPYLYRDITLLSMRALRTFCESIASKPERAKGIRSLEIRIDDDRYEDDDAFLPERPTAELQARADLATEYGDGVLRVSQVSTLFSQLVALRQLEVGGVPRELGDSIFLEVGIDRLVELQELVMYDYLPDGLDETSKGRTRRETYGRHFSRARKLRTLRLIEFAPCLPLPYNDEAVAACTQVESLEIRTYLYAHPPRQDFSALFPNLRNFNLEAYRYNDYVQPYVNTLPPTIRDLRLSRLEDPEQAGLEVWDDVLGGLQRYPLLEILYLPAASFAPNQLLTSLASLHHLRHLGFGLGCNLPDNVLLGLFRIPWIKRVTLNHIAAKQGSPCLDWNDALEVDLATLRFPDSWEWREPDWPPGATLEGLQAALALAKARNIAVDGTALEAIDFYKRWRQEELSVAAERGVQLGDWTFREALGFSWEEVSKYMAQAWKKEREEHNIRPPGHEDS